MSKKKNSDLNNPVAQLSHAAEYKIIRHDLIKVALLNAVYLAAVLGVYYLNRQNNIIDNWLRQALHF